MNPQPPFPPHDDLEARITALLLGELPEAEAAALREQIAADPELQKLHDELARTIGLVREAGAVLADDASPAAEPLTLSTERREKLLATFKTVQLPVAPKKPRIAIPWRETGAVAAMLAMLAGVAVLLVRTSVLPEDRLAESMEFLYAGASKKKSDEVTALSAPRLSLEDWSDTLSAGHGSHASERPIPKAAARSISPEKLSLAKGERNASPTPAAKSEPELVNLFVAAPEDGRATKGLQPEANRFYFSANGAQNSAAVESKVIADTEPASRPTIYLGTAEASLGREDGTKSSASPAPEAEGYKSRYGRALKKEDEVLSRRGAVAAAGQPMVPALGDVPAVGAQFLRSSGAQPSAGTQPPATPEPQLFGSVVNGTANAPVGGAMPDSDTSALRTDSAAASFAKDQRESVRFMIPSVTPSGIISSGSFGGGGGGGGLGGGGGFGGGGLGLIENRGSLAVTDGNAATKYSVPRSEWPESRGFAMAIPDAVADPVLGYREGVLRDLDAAASLSQFQDLSRDGSTPNSPPPPTQSLAWFEGKAVGDDFVVASPLPSADRKESAGKTEFETNQGGSANKWKLSAGARGFYDDFYADGAATAPASPAGQADLGFVSGVNGPVAGLGGVKNEIKLRQNIRVLDGIEAKAQPEAADMAPELWAFRSAKDANATATEVNALSDGAVNGRDKADAVQQEARSRVLVGAKAESQATLNFGETTKEMAAKNYSGGELAPLSKLKAASAVSDPAFVGVLERPAAAEKKPATDNRLEELEAKSSRGGRLAAIVLPLQTDRELGEVVVAGKPLEVRPAVDELEQLSKEPTGGRRRQLAESPLGYRGGETRKKVATKGFEDHLKSTLSVAAATAAKPAAIDSVSAEKNVELKDVDAPAPRNPAPNAAVPQPEVSTAENAFSTFSLNVSDVSFKLAAASLEKGVMPDAASVRTEEFINAFDYRDPEPPPGVPVAFATERARYPFAHDRDLVRFSVKTAAAGRQPGKPYNLVLAIDNSGSMERADRVRILQECLRVLSRQLQPQDKVSVVSFARTARLWMDGLAGNAFGELPQMIGTLTPEGGTNLEEAMNLAYKTALRHFVAGGVNRVVLITDGAANLGDVEPDSLKQKVEAFRKQGVALDCFGIGWDGLNDDLLEVLSRNGDGRYGFINTPEAAASDFAGQLAGALKVAASDVKVQVEWNPRRVTAFRQIGYAKHQLKKEQFRDNTVDAAEIAAAEAGNALYAVQVNPAGEGPLGTVRVRFRVPNTSDYREHEWIVPYAAPAPALDQASTTLRLAATASAFSEWLVASPFAAEVTPAKLLNYLQGVPQLTPADPRPSQLETMIRQAKTISGQ